MNNKLYINKNFKNSELGMMKKYFDKLWPLNRSLTGNDVRKTHKILKEVIPLKTFEIKSLKKVHDWQVPLEWNAQYAYIKNLKGKKIIDFKKNNLHLASYSSSYKNEIKLKDLKKKLHYIKSLPTAIPYKTLYYKNDWAFCLSYKDFKKLKDKKYSVEIGTTLKKGSMTMSEYCIPGISKKEILVHTYTCHPSMANNEISGPLVASFLARRIKNNFYSYRFIFAPETIGSIAYLSKYGDQLKKNLIAGYICTCTGIKNFVTYKKSKTGNTIADKCAIKVINKLKDLKTKVKKFSPTGSDERQYCSIGYNLPVGSIMSKSYGEYREYHTSLDNKKIINFKHLQRIIEIYFDVFCEIEQKHNYKVINDIKKNIKKKNKVKKIYPINLKIYGEPRISKYKIHYGYKNYCKADNFTMAIKWLIHYSSGDLSVNQISKISKIGLSTINSALDELCKSKIFRKVMK